jgi:HK97 family phage major capsid protein
MATIVDYKPGHLESAGQEKVTALGKAVVEQLQKEGKDVKEMIANKLGVAKEALDIGQNSLYTTAIAGFIERKLRPRLVAAGVIRSINVEGRGVDSIKIPVRNTLITAADLPDSGQVSYSTSTFESTTVTLRYSYASQDVTHELTQFANVDLIQEVIGEIGDAIGRKVDSDIIAALKAATTTANGNLVKLGATATITFDALVDGRKSAVANFAEPDVMLTSPETEAAIIKLGNFSGSGGYIVGALAMQGQNGATYPVPASFLGMRIVVSQQVDDDDTYLIDSARTGYIARRNGVEVFDGRKTGYLAYEVIGAHAYGIGIVQPKALYRIEENAA